MKKKMFSLFVVLSLAFIGFSVQPAFADDGKIKSGDAGEDSITFLKSVNAGVQDDFDKWVAGALNWAIGIAAMVSVAILIGAGYSYITANGDEGKIQKATTSLTWAIVGLVICFVAAIIVQFVVKGILGGADATTSGQ